MTDKKRKKKPKAEAAPMAIDKSETLAHESAPIPLGDDAKALVAVINAPVDDPGGHRKAAIMASAAAGGTPFCPICGTLRTADLCAIDGHRFEVI